MTDLNPEDSGIAQHVEGTVTLDNKKGRPLEILHRKSIPPIVSIVGNSGSGKTTLLEKLISELKTKGFKVGTIKHDVHGFEMDKPGKDSWRHKKAGADVSVISSPNKIGVVMDVDFDHDPKEIISFFPGIDIIMTEGYKRGDKPKLEVFRPEVHDTPVCKDDDSLLALISDHSIELGVPRFSLNDIDGIASFLIKYFGLNRRGGKGKRKSA